MIHIMVQHMHSIQRGPVVDISVSLLVKQVFLWMYPYLVQEPSGNLVETPSPTSHCCNQEMVYLDSTVNLRLESVLVSLVMDLFQLSVVLQILLPITQKKKISYSLSMEKQRLHSILIGLVVVFYSHFSLQLKELYMTMLDLEESSDLIILKRRKYTITTAVLSFLSQKTIMDSSSIHQQLHVLMLMVSFHLMRHQLLDVLRYSIH